MSSLFSLAEQYRSLQALADSETDIPEEVLRDTLEGLGGELQVKAQNVAKFILNQEAMATAIENAAATLKQRADRLRRRTDNMRQYLLVNLQSAGIGNIESPEVVLNIRKNPPSVIVFDEASVPVEFMTHKPAPPPAPNKTLIKEILKKGDDVPGCRLEQSVRLEVK